MIRIFTTMCIVFAFLFTNNKLKSQNFISTHDTLVPNIYPFETDLGDYDNDGDLDIISGGVVFRNDNGHFTKINLESIFNGAGAWGDWDNDGDLDAIISGWVGLNHYTKIYINNSGAFTFSGTIINSNSFTELGDYNNDNIIDILLGNEIYEHLINDSVINLNTNFISASDGKFIDYDNDGDQDIVISSSTNNHSSVIYCNNDGIYNEELIFSDADHSSIACYDIDNSGTIDLFQTQFPTNSSIYFNNSGNFNQWGVISNFQQGDVDFGDYDIDGDLDILITGWDCSGNWITEIYNNANNSFININADLFCDQTNPGGSSSSVNWGDMDGDGDIDVCVTGMFESSAKPFIIIYTNDAGDNTFKQNNPPLPPDGLNAIVNGNKVTLSWNKAYDIETSQDGLSYNIYVGTNSINCDIVSPLSNLSNGYRKVPKIGNVNLDTSWEIKCLDYGKYYWSVQTIDNNYIGSNFAQVDSFIITDTLPSFSILSNPVDTNICEGQNTYFSISEDGDVSSYQWQVSNDSGITWSNLNNNIYYDNTDGDTLYLNNPPLSYSANLYRCKVKFICNCRKYSTSAVLNILPSPSLNLPDDTLICGYNFSINAGPGFIGYLWNDGSINQTLDIDTTGVYYVQVVDSNGCSMVDTSIITIIHPIIINYSEEICSGDSIFLENAYQTEAGIYYDTLSSSIGCDSISITDLNILNNTSDTIIETVCDSFVSPIGNISSSGIYIDTIQNISGCDSIIYIDLTVLSSTYTYIYDTVCSNYSTPSGTYIVNSSGIYVDTIPNSVGCDSIITLNLFVQTPYQNQQLCLVTVDPTIGKNKIMWNKTPNVGTESYNIYKEVTTNVYNWVGNVPYDSASYIIDYGSDPMSHGDKYKITSIDTCGNESELDSCMFHKTINLVIYSYGTTMGLNWDSYEVEDNSFYPLQYYIYRGTTPYNLQIIDSLSGSFNTYNDNNVTSLYYYMVGAVRDDCNSGNKSVYQTLSNKKDNSDYVTNLEYESKGYVPLSIYPNPSNKQISIYNGSSNDFENYNLIIIDVSDRVIKKENIKNHALIIDVSNLCQGTYFIELIGKNIFRGKFIKN